MENIFERLLYERGCEMVELYKEHSNEDISDTEDRLRLLGGLIVKRVYESASTNDSKAADKKRKKMMKENMAKFPSYKNYRFKDFESKI